MNPRLSSLLLLNKVYDAFLVEVLLSRRKVNLAAISIGYLHLSDACANSIDK
jgi:hypothetical protein